MQTQYLYCPPIDDLLTYSLQLRPYVKANVWAYYTAQKQAFKAPSVWKSERVVVMNKHAQRFSKQLTRLNEYKLFERRSA